jgi:hypothetical protein
MLRNRPVGAGLARPSSGGACPAPTGRRRARGRVALTLACWLLISCQQAPRPEVLRGLVTDLQPRDIARAEWVQVRAEDGRELRFQVADSVAFPPSHLREHMIFAEPVTVTYEIRDGVATALQIED